MKSKIAKASSLRSGHEHQKNNFKRVSNKHYLTFLGCFVAAFGFAQEPYSNYLDATSEWREYGGGWNGVAGYTTHTTYYFDGTTVINGVGYWQRYAKVRSTVGNWQGGTTVTEEVYGPISVREDASGKFYLINPNTNEEQVFFDSQEILSANVGDPFPYPGAVCNVESIETVNVGSLSLKKVKGQNTWDYSGTVEGIGVVSLACAWGIEGNGWLNCYTKGGNTVSFNSSISCDLFPVPNRIHLGVGQQEMLSTRLFPNPAKDLVTIETSVPNQHVVITDIYGRNVMQTNMAGEIQQVDVSALPSGVYVVTIAGKSSQKLVKI